MANALYEASNTRALTGVLVVNPLEANLSNAFENNVDGIIVCMGDDVCGSDWLVLLNNISRLVSEDAVVMVSFSPNAKVDTQQQWHLLDHINFVPVLYSTTQLQTTACPTSLAHLMTSYETVVYRAEQHLQHCAFDHSSYFGILVFVICTNVLRTNCKLNGCYFMHRAACGGITERTNVHRGFNSITKY